MNATTQQRWTNAYTYAVRQGCDAAVACAYADHVARLIRRGLGPMAARHADIFAAWRAQNS